MTPLPRGFIKEALRIINADCSVRVPSTIPENGWEGEVSRFTSSDSNGGCWVVLVFPRPFFSGEKGFPCATYTGEKNPSKKNAFYGKKKSSTAYAKKKKRVMLISTIELRFPQFPWVQA